MSRWRSTSSRRRSSEMEGDEEEIQWDLFLKHHAKGSWWGRWTSYDYMGDVIDETVASVDLIPQTIPTEETTTAEKATSSVQHSHRIVMGSIESDCETCFDSVNIKSMPIATYYQKGTFFSSNNNNSNNPTSNQRKKRNMRCGGVGMVIGPTILKSGAISTELILSHGNGRLRVIFQHAPVWERNVEPGSCPPQGLKLYRTIISRETLQHPSTSSPNNDNTLVVNVSPPTPQLERQNPPSPGNPRFFRPVPPYAWHAQWSGTSWTWGPTTGNRGWSINQMEEADAWHGRPMGDIDGTWSLRLPGGILLQSPRVILAGGNTAGLCRLAWLPEDDNHPHPAKLLRLEAGIVALEPILDQTNDDDDTMMMIGFYPPSLTSYRCDILTKTGELENASIMDKLRNQDELLRPNDESNNNNNNNNGSGGDDQGNSGLDAIRDALKF